MYIRLKENIKINASGGLFNQETGENFALNETGIKIIQALQKETDSDKIAESISQEYKKNIYNVKADMEDFFCMLKQFELIEDEN